MSARTRTGSHHRAAVPAARPLVAFAFSLVMALGGAWVPSAASAASAAPELQGGSDVFPSRGPKPTERSCSSGKSPERKADNPPSGGGRLGYGHRSAAPSQPAAGSGRNSGDDCPDDEPSGAGERRDAGTPARSRPAPITPAPGSGAGPGAKADGPPARSQPSGNDASGVDDQGSDGRGADDRRAPGTGSEQDRASPKSPSGGGSASSGGGRGRGTGSGNRRPGGAPGAGRDGHRSAPSADTGRAPGGGAGDGLPGFRSAPARRVRSEGPGPGALRVPGSVLLASPGIPSTVVLSSTTAAALEARRGATVAGAPIPRTGGEISASTLLALLLLVAGVTLRRAARADRRPPA